ncbi:MAG: class I SAM-dependent methyltransferase [Planctomycetota bacterium]
MPQQTPIRVAVCADPPHEVPLQQRADEIARSLKIEKTKIGQPDCELLLAVMRDRLELRVLHGEADLIGGTPVAADLTGIDTASPAGRKLDVPLLKAVGIKRGMKSRPSVIDCTAGLGEDAWLLASHGCIVTALERQPVVAALLEDAVRRANRSQPDVANRITLYRVNASKWLASTSLPSSNVIDAIVLDPMFPLVRKAKERKPMRVLRMLAGDNDDASDLLDAALNTGVHRVCVKRPLKAPAIVNEKRPAPDVVHKGKAVRFDVYLNH